MIDTIVFDLDGTLLNTLEDLKDSVNYALSRQNFPQCSLTEIRSFVFFKKTDEPKAKTIKIIGANLLI